MYIVYRAYVAIVTYYDALYVQNNAARVSIVHACSRWYGIGDAKNSGLQVSVIVS